MDLQSPPKMGAGKLLGSPIKLILGNQNSFWSSKQSILVPAKMQAKYGRPFLQTCQREILLEMDSQSTDGSEMGQMKVIDIQPSAPQTILKE